MEQTRTPESTRRNRRHTRILAIIRSLDSMGAITVTAENTSLIDELRQLLSVKPGRPHPPRLS